MEHGQTITSSFVTKLDKLAPVFQIMPWILWQLLLQRFKHNTQLKVELNLIEVININKYQRLLPFSKCSHLQLQHQHLHLHPLLDQQLFLLVLLSLILTEQFALQIVIQPSISNAQLTQAHVPLQVSGQFLLTQLKVKLSLGRALKDISWFKWEEEPPYGMILLVMIYKDLSVQVKLLIAKISTLTNWLKLTINKLTRL